MYFHHKKVIKILFPSPFSNLASADPLVLSETFHPLTRAGGDFHILDCHITNDQGPTAGSSAVLLLLIFHIIPLTRESRGSRFSHNFLYIFKNLTAKYLQGKHCREVTVLEFDLVHLSLSAFFPFHIHECRNVRLSTLPSFWHISSIFLYFSSS